MSPITQTFNQQLLDSSAIFLWHRSDLIKNYLSLSLKSKVKWRKLILVIIITRIQINFHQFILSVCIYDVLLFEWIITYYKAIMCTGQCFVSLIKQNIVSSICFWNLYVSMSGFGIRGQCITFIFHRIGIDGTERDLNMITE